MNLNLREKASLHVRIGSDEGLDRFDRVGLENQQRSDLGISVAEQRTGLENTQTFGGCIEVSAMVRLRFRTQSGAVGMIFGNHGKKHALTRSC
jgi:hypothetical protein